MSDIHETLREFVSTNFLFGEPFELQDQDSLLEHGLIDSTGVLELVTFLEQTWQIAITDHELVPENLDSIDRLADFIVRKTSSAALT